MAGRGEIGTAAEGPWGFLASASSRTGGTPYGASHVSGSEGDAALSAEEIALAQAQGRRLAEVAMRLAGSR